LENVILKIYDEKREIIEKTTFGDNLSINYRCLKKFPGGKKSHRKKFTPIPINYKVIISEHHNHLTMVVVF